MTRGSLVARPYFVAPRWGQRGSDGRRAIRLDPLAERSEKPRVKPRLWSAWALDW